MAAWLPPQIRWCLLSTTLVFLTCTASAATRRVPFAFPTIQSAVDVSVSGDSVLVSPGVYSELVDFADRSIHLVSEAGPATTIIDGGGLGPVLRVAGGEIAGFTIRNGRAPMGGGILISGSNGTVIRDNIIEDNAALGDSDTGLGGGICIVFESGAEIHDNIIRDNYAGDSGGGVYALAFGSNPVIIRANLIEGNGCHVGGGGVSISSAELRDNVILNNSADNFGGGVCTRGGGSVTGNTIVGNYNDNSLAHGAGIHFQSAPLVVARNIVVGNRGRGASGYGIKCSGGSPSPAVVECNDSWQNDNAAFFGCDTTGRGNKSFPPRSLCPRLMASRRQSVSLSCARHTSLTLDTWHRTLSCRSGD